MEQGGRNELSCSVLYWSSTLLQVVKSHSAQTLQYEDHVQHVQKTHVRAHALWWLGAHAYRLTYKCVCVQSEEQEQLRASLDDARAEIGQLQQELAASRALDASLQESMQALTAKLEQVTVTSRGLCSCVPWFRRVDAGY